MLSLTGSVTFSFTVGQEFAAGTYETTGKVGTAVTNAVKNAAKIVADSAGLTDVDKLIAYRTAICNMVEYNHAAVETDTAYGNPWQLIWVFDGDSSTNVVCEGYSKAFQYLCDLTKFSRAVTAYSVTGYMDGGAHMWNMVSMPNGKNYLVDVTNCDSGTIGAPDKLFLAGGSGSASRGYTVYGIYYQYSSDTLAMFSDKDRTLSGYYYKDDPTRPTAPAEVSTVTVTGVSLTLKGQVGIYVYVKMPSGAQTARLTYPKTGEVKNYFLDMDPSCYVADSNQYKFLYPNVPAKELTQPLALEVFDANGNAMAITHTSLGSQGKKFTCKAVDYCNTILASPTQSDALKDLVKAILNYGQCAQIQFDFDTGNPANPKGYLAEEMKTVTPVSANDPVIPSNAADVGWEYGTLSLKGAVSANLYFSKAITAKNENGKAYKVTARSGGKWSITVDNIPAKNLGDKFTVVASYGGKSATIKYSALSYANAVLRSDTQPDTLKELCKAIILYNKYAKAYFGN